MKKIKEKTNDDLQYSDAVLVEISREYSKQLNDTYQILFRDEKQSDKVKINRQPMPNLKSATHLLYLFIYLYKIVFHLYLINSIKLYS